MIADIETLQIAHSILVVDDNEEILDFLIDDLSEKYKVYSANHAKIALDILEREIIHLIVSDIVMPDIDGYAFCNMVKSHTEYSHIPFILLTAKNTLQSKINGLEKGADAYIEKPFSPEHLRMQIQSLLANRSRVKDFFSSYPQQNLKKTTITLEDEKFLVKLNSTILAHIDDPALDVDILSSNLFISRPTLYRKIKSLLDVTPNELINTTRLKKSAELLLMKRYTINEISMMVGFSSASHFGRNFSKQFGISPSTYVHCKNR